MFRCEPALQRPKLEWAAVHAASCLCWQSGLLAKGRQGTSPCSACSQAFLHVALLIDLCSPRNPLLHAVAAHRLNPGGCRGQQDLMRFANKVSPTSKYFPPGGPKNSGHGEPHNSAQSYSAHAAGLTTLAP